MKRGCSPPAMICGVTRTGARIVDLLRRRRRPLSALDVRNTLELSTNATHCALRKLSRSGIVSHTRRGLNQSDCGAYGLEGVAA